VIDLDTDIKKLSESEQEDAVANGFAAYTRASEITRKRNEDFLHSRASENADFDFSSHLRGSTEDGYRRLLSAFFELYEDRAPILILSRLVKEHLFEIHHVFEEVLLDAIYGQKQSNYRKKH
jgi:hypothetical protein